MASLHSHFASYTYANNIKSSHYNYVITHWCIIACQLPKLFHTLPVEKTLREIFYCWNIPWELRDGVGLTVHSLLWTGIYGLQWGLLCGTPWNSTAGKVACRGNSMWCPSLSIHFLKGQTDATEACNGGLHGMYLTVHLGDWEMKDEQLQLNLFEDILHWTPFTVHIYLLWTEGWDKGM